MICRVNISRSFEESDGGFLRRLCHRLAPCADEPVGDVDVGGKVFGGGVLLEDGTDGDVEIPGQARNDGVRGRVLRQLLDPFLIAIDIGEGHDFVAGEDQEAVVDAGFATGGEPDVFRHQAGADNGGLLALDDGHGLIGMLFEKVLSKQALHQVPGSGQLPGLAHQGMHPGDPRRCVRIFDTMACLRIILHDLAGPAPAFDVELEEDGGTIAGDADTVVFDEGFDGGGWQDGAEEGDQVGVAVGADGAFDVGDGDGAEEFGLRRDRLGLLRGPVKPGMTKIRVIGEVLLRSIVVATGGGVVAAADVVGELVAGLVDVERETLLIAAPGTDVPGGRPVVGL